MSEEVKEVVVNKEDIKRRTMYLLFMFLFVLGIFVGVLLSIYTQHKDITEDRNFKVYLDKEEQVFRDENGRMIYAIKKNGKIYLPISELGSYLGYMTVRNEDGLFLYPIEDTGEYIIKGFQTKTYDGEEVDESVLKNGKLNLFFVWATWCPDCKNQIEELNKLGTYFKDNNIQFFSMATDDEASLNINEARNLTSGVGVDYYIYKDSVLNQKLIGNATYIPKIVILDSDGRLVKIYQENLTSEAIKGIFDNILEN